MAVPKPRPLTRPPPRSLVYRPPTQPSANKVKPLGLVTVKDLPLREQASSESRPRLPTTTPAPRVRSLALVSRASQEKNRKEACLSEWQEILHLMGSASGLQSSLANSKYPQALLKKSLEKFTAGTLERYLAAAKQFLDFLGLSNQTIASIDVAFKCRFPTRMREQPGRRSRGLQDRPRPILKALAWLSRNADVSALQPLLQASLVRAFITQPTADRKEALPLPLAVVVEWEKYICSPHCPQDRRLFLGGLLLALHGGLRFGDLQRIRLNSLSLTSTSLRGVCWQTKTTKRGQPFAVTLHGLSGRALDSLWVLPFLRAVQSAWLATEAAMEMSVIPDFILPVLTNLGGLSRPSSIYAQPMAYSQSLAAMRHFLTIPWQDSTKPVPVTSEESRAFTLRSLKVCLLAAGAQVRATEEARQHQGHHKSPSVQLYSRDDTILALDLQRQICLACAQGWRPARPIARGGQPPTLEPPFHVDRSQPNPAYQVSSFGDGVSRFVCSREADLESHRGRSSPRGLSPAISPRLQPPRFQKTTPKPSLWRSLPFKHTAHQSRKTSLRRLQKLSSPRSAYFATARGE